LSEDTVQSDDDGEFKIKSKTTEFKPAKKIKIKIQNPKFREPTAEDIKKAQEMMPVIKSSEAPMCMCGEKARARKNRKQGSPGFGYMFWWCSKAKSDETKCFFKKRADVRIGV